MVENDGGKWRRRGKWRQSEEERKKENKDPEEETENGRGGPLSVSLGKHRRVSSQPILHIDLLAAHLCLRPRQPGEGSGRVNKECYQVI